MARTSAIPIGFFILVIASKARAEDAPFRPSQTPLTAPSAAADTVEKPHDGADERHRRDWMLSLEAVGTAPVDVGAQVGLQTPFGLRVFGGYGWIPAASLGWLKGTSASSDGASATVDTASGSGHIFRLKVGIQPFQDLGLYLDAGYARADLAATVDLTGSVTNVGSLSGGYYATSSLDLWLVELGYQWVVERRLVVGLGLGFMGTIDAHTTITPVGAGVDSTALGVAESAVNGALESYGFVPTLSLRVGFDVL
jgi:hypothetical protein